MESRKVQQVGGGTYTVSLPREWAEESGVEAGAPVYLYAHRDGSLVVRRRERDDSDLAAVTATVEESSTEAAERRLRAAYAAGYKRITLAAADTFTGDQRRAVTAATRALTGIEVVETSSTEITIEGMLDAADVSVRQSVLQLRFVVTCMHEAAVDALVGDAGDPAHVRDRVDEVDRAVALLTRHFNRALSELSEVDDLGVDRQTLFHYYTTANCLEEVADNAVEIARVAQGLEADLPPDLVATIESLAADTGSAVEDAADAVVNRADPETALDARTRVVERCRTEEASLHDADPAVASPASRVLDRLARTAAAAGEVASVALQARL
jgi:phosphate uptake regulator